MRRLNLGLSEEAYQNLEALRIRMDKPSKAEVLRSAVALLNLAELQKSEGKRLAIISEEGEVVTFIELTLKEGKVTNLQNPIEEILSILTEQEKRVICLRIGIVDEEPGRRRSLSEIARELNVTRYRIRQIEAKALQKLRIPIPAFH